ncbi:MAG: mechanosensitive ion channel [Moorea sp. SIO2B7]|nr:mechanosensitive ion channel [Moorena sp. SIO2B7]
MNDSLLETIIINTGLLLGLLSFAGVIVLLSSLFIPRLIGLLIARLVSTQAGEAYRKIVAPYRIWLGLSTFLAIADSTILILPTANWVKFGEIPLSLSIAILISWLGSRLFKQFFDTYLLDIAVKSKRRINTELLIVAKFSVNTIIIVIVILIFAQTHKINIIGLIASLGIGGLAIAFAAQKTLEQLLGGIVIYVDRPFITDDYIGLPDGTFGRVESIGLRSTKIRTSGKGTLMIIPNSSLTQVNIENFTGVKKVISLIYLTFYNVIPEEEKALIRQVILDSTKDIFGLDHRNTRVEFKDIIKNGNQNISQAQISFFLLGSGKISMELRRQFLDIANQNITTQLKEYGIPFEIEEKMINVDSPITI